MSSCGGVINTKVESNFSFVYPNTISSGGTNFTGTCYVVENNVMRDDIVKCIVSDTPSYQTKSGATVTSMYTSRTSSVTYTLYHWNIEVKGKIELYYQTVDGKSHLFAKLKDVYSTLVGTTGDRGFKAPLYAATRFSYALAVTMFAGTPADSSSIWKKCLGGWWSAGVSCNSNCVLDKYGNPPGGTMYSWGSYDMGQKWEHSGLTPGRYDTDIVYDLGVPDSNSKYVYIYGRMMDGGNGCDKFRSAPTFAQIVEIPPINVCAPEITSETEERDICGGTITHTTSFSANDLLGQESAILSAEYTLANDPGSADWAARLAANPVTIYHNQPFSVTMTGLKPNKNYCFRYKIVLNTALAAESDYVVRCSKTLSMPSIKTVVPDFTEAECEKLKNCEYINQLGEES